MEADCDEVAEVEDERLPVWEVSSVETSPRTPRVLMNRLSPRRHSLQTRAPRSVEDETEDCELEEKSARLLWADRMVAPGRCGERTAQAALGGESVLLGETGRWAGSGNMILGLLSGCTMSRASSSCVDCEGSPPSDMPAMSCDAADAGERGGGRTLHAVMASWWMRASEARSEVEVATAATWKTSGLWELIRSQERGQGMGLKAPSRSPCMQAMRSAISW